MAEKILGKNGHLVRENIACFLTDSDMGKKRSSKPRTPKKRKATPKKVPATKSRKTSVVLVGNHTKTKTE